MRCSATKPAHSPTHALADSACSLRPTRAPCSWTKWRRSALGPSQERRIDTRVIAATNAPLEEMVRAGTFRSDLYHRLRVLCINLPPLRERTGDILLLARHFLRLYTPAGRPPLELDEAAQRTLASYSWPGNVRELQNAILRAAIA